MPKQTTIAHLTDVHLGPIAGFKPRYWNAKRAAGYLNWQRNRRTAYQRAVLDRIVADVRATAPDHIAVTGDLANIGLPQEHINALAWLQSLGAPEEVTVVPGNHDIYSAIGSDPGTQRWSAYMASNAKGALYADGTAAFPFVRVLGDIALISVNSAVPTPPLIAWGHVGKAQMERLADILGRLGRDGLFRLVLIHHPPLPGQTSSSRALRDAAVLEQVLLRHGAELVIHGHNHHSTLVWGQWGAARLPIVGAPSASLGRHLKGEALARYNLYGIERDAEASWTIELVGRGLSEPGGAVVELERRLLSPA